MSAHDVILVARTIEDSGHRFYTAMAREAGHPEARRLFARLAADEVEHVADLDRLEEALGGSGVSIDDEEIALSYLRDIIQSGVFPEPHHAGPLAREIVDGRDAVETGIAAERDAARFYEQAAASCRTEEGRGMFLRMAEEERAHEAALEALRPRLAG